MNYELWIINYELRAVKSDGKRAIMNYELWIMNWKKRKEKRRKETKKNMPTNETNETNETKRGEEQLWIINYELKSGEGWRVTGEEWREKSNYEL